MSRLLKVKSVICNCIIIREWIENGEFDRTDRIIVAGTRFQATIVKGFLKGKDKRIYYYTKPKLNYRHYNKTKWIIFNNNMIKTFPKNDCNVLIMPKS